MEDWGAVRARAEEAINRSRDWDEADHYEDCPAIPHVEHECDCPVIENDDDDTEEACRIRCEVKAVEVCDCYLGVMRDLRNGIRAALKICESTSAFRHEEIKRYQAEVARLEKERDEARAEVGRLRAITSPGDAAAFEEYMAAREVHWVRRVSRLEGLILDWYTKPDDQITPTKTLLVEARRIRAQREEVESEIHRRHPRHRGGMGHRG